MAKIDQMICPLLGKQCIEDGAIVMVDGKPETHACRFWIYVHGKNPQDGTDMKHGDCAHAWTPVLLIENSKVQRETGAAIESFRNVMHNDMSLALSLPRVNNDHHEVKIIGGIPE